MKKFASAAIKRITVWLMAPIVAALLANPTWGQTSPAKTSQVWLSQSRLSSAVNVTNVSAATLLPTPGFVAWVCNTGANDAYLNFDASAVVAVANANSWLKAGTCGAYDLHPDPSRVYTYVAAITASSTTTIVIEAGQGTPPSGPSGVAIIGSASVTQGTSPWITDMSGITPIVAGSVVSSSVFKASAGNLYSAYAQSTVSGYLMIFNATTAPSNGATTAGTASGNLVQCIGPSTQPFLSFDPGPPEVYSVGITAVFSSTGCGTLTLSATAFIHGSVK